MPIILEEHQPRTLKEAVNAIYYSLQDNEVEFIKKHKFQATALIHHGLGRELRNKWGLWDKDSILYKFFVIEFGIGHADDMSGLILDSVVATVLNEEFDPVEKAEYYRNYWIEQKINPITLESM